MAPRRVVVVANLKPRKLANFMSNGMVLCATGPDGKVEFVTPPEGAKVGWKPVQQYLAGRPRPPKYYLQFGEAGGYGVCAELNTDLRRRDQSPASAVTLYSCRIGKDERLG